MEKYKKKSVTLDLREASLQMNKAISATDEKKCSNCSDMKSIQKICF